MHCSIAKVGYIRIDENLAGQLCLIVRIMNNVTIPKIFMVLYRLISIFFKNVVSYFYFYFNFGMKCYLESFRYIVMNVECCLFCRLSRAPLGARGTVGHLSLTHPSLSLSLSMLYSIQPWLPRAAANWRHYVTPARPLDLCELNFEQISHDLKNLFILCIKYELCFL